MLRPSLLATAGHIARVYLLARRRAPFLASFKPTYRCNLRCQQCPFYTLECPDIPYLEARKALEALHRRGNRLLIFEGGEPMLWRDGERTIHDLIRDARACFACVGMTTNGVLPLAMDLDVVWVSVDGLAETHNRLRGAPVFERVMENIRAARRREAGRRPRVYAHVTINNQNAGEVPELLSFLRGQVDGVTAQFYYPYHGRDALFLNFDQRARLLERLIALKRGGYPLLNSVPALRALRRNTWRCEDWLVDSADPDGAIRQGCYLRGRADIDCARCGFSPHTEASLAYQGNLAAILAGLRIFFTAG